MSFTIRRKLFDRYGYSIVEYEDQGGLFLSGRIVASSHSTEDNLQVQTSKAVVAERLKSGAWEFVNQKSSDKRLMK